MYQLPIKSVLDDNFKPSNRLSENEVVCGTFFIVVALFVAVFAIGMLPDDPLNPNNYIWLQRDLSPVVLVMGISGLFYIFYRGSGYEELRNKNYHAYLETVSIEIVRQAMVSPEMDDVSRKQITSFVNDRYPGWSFMGLAQSV